MFKSFIKQTWYFSLIIALSITVLFIDFLTPLGIAEVILYCIPVIMSIRSINPLLPIILAVLVNLFSFVGFYFSPSGNLEAAILNRFIAGITIWIMALIVRQVILTRNASERLSWLKIAMGQLTDSLRGEFTMEQLGQNVVEFLEVHTGMKMGAIFVRNNGYTLLTFCAGKALPKEYAKNEISFGEGFLGEVAHTGTSMQICDVNPDYYKFSSALGEKSPSWIFIFPLIANGRVMGVIEAAYPVIPNEQIQELLKNIGETIAITIRSVHYSQDLVNFNQLLEEEVAAQNEELKITNEELEKHSRELRKSFVQLESQQAELEQSNQQLEEQTLQLEQQNNLLNEKNKQLLVAQMSLIERTKEMETASKFKSEFLANMSHELRTPLNSTLILAKMLSENKEQNLTKEQVSYAEVIYSSGNDLLNLINDILDLSKVEAGKLRLNNEKIRIRPLLEGLERVFKTTALEKEIIFIVEQDESIPNELITDKFRVEQVLKNFLSNAFKFTEKGSVKLKVRANLNNLFFDVEDSGIGITPNEQEAIFEAFRQADGNSNRKYAGTGLGLSISKELSKLLGGKIYLSSEKGKGSTFTLALPLNIQVQAENPQLFLPINSPDQTLPPEKKSWPQFSFTDDREKMGSFPRSVLIIEDDEVFAKMLYNVAHEMGFAAILTPMAEEALWLIYNHPPQAILLDVKLPDYNGLMVLDQLKQDKKTRHIPVHVISATDFSGSALSLGAMGFLEKPVNMDQLKEAFKQLATILEQQMKHILIVEDNAEERESIIHLISGINKVKFDAVGTAEEALQLLSSRSYDCMIMDLNLTGQSGIELLNTLAQDNFSYSKPPAIIYTAGGFTPEDEEQLSKYSRSIILKGTRSQERLLNEVSLFLHWVESDLPDDRQKMLTELRARDKTLAGRNILLADDDVRNIFALTSALEAQGAKIFTARNGREALDKAISIDNLELILMDIMMPEMDGLEAIMKIRQEPAGRNISIIALTAKAMKDDREKCLAVGANDYMSKPIEMDKLLSLIRVWLPTPRSYLC